MSTKASNNQHAARARNLALANNVRLRRAALKRSVRGGTTPLQTALTDDSTRNLTVYEVVQYRHRYGPSRTMKTLEAVSIHPATVCGDLTNAQIEAIAEYQDLIGRERYDIRNNRLRAEAAATPGPPPLAPHIITLLTGSGSKTAEDLAALTGQPIPEIQKALQWLTVHNFVEATADTNNVYHSIAVIP